MNKTVQTFQLGMTLLEITVVLLVLAALAGTVIPYLSNTSARAACIATESSMAIIRDAILGDFENPGYYEDMDRLPSPENAQTAYHPHWLFEQGAGAAEQPAFNPVTRKGWRGPYLYNSAAAESLAGTNFVDTVNYVNAAIAANDVVIFDAFVIANQPLKPIIVQDPSGVADDSDARLLSAGPDSILDTQLTDANVQNDDRVLYLFTPGAAPAKACSEL